MPRKSRVGLSKFALAGNTGHGFVWAATAEAAGKKLYRANKSEHAAAGTLAVVGENGVTHCFHVNAWCQDGSNKLRSKPNAAPAAAAAVLAWSPYVSNPKWSAAELAPKSAAPKSVAPKSVAPTSEAPKSVAPTSVAPKSVAPTSVAPTSVAPKSVAPTSEAPTSVAPTSEAPKSAVFGSITHVQGVRTG